MRIYDPSIYKKGPCRVNGVSLEAGEVYSLEDLKRGNLEGYALNGCIFAECNFEGSSFADANLRNSNFGNCNLCAASFCRAWLVYTGFDNCNLRGCDFTGADLTGASFSGADINGAIGLPTAPVVKGLKKKILAAVEAKPALLNMETWHGHSDCGTTHCLAGWAVIIAGDDGQRLEELYGTNVAGALIFNASEGEIPDFYETDEKAMEWLKGQD